MCLYILFFIFQDSVEINEQNDDQHADRQIGFLKTLIKLGDEKIAELQNEATEVALKTQLLINQRDERIAELEKEATETGMLIKQKDERIAELSKAATENGTLIKQRIERITEKEQEAIEDGEYEVEKIMDLRVRNNKEPEFKIRWKGFCPNADKWLPKSDLNCDELLLDFLKDKNLNDYKQDDGNEDESLTDGDADQSENSGDVGDSDNDNEEENDIDEKEDQSDKDYVPRFDAAAKPTTSGGRQSGRPTKKPQPLIYKHAPVCCVCNVKLMNVVGVTGPLVCSMKCSQKWQKKTNALLMPIKLKNCANSGKFIFHQ